MQTPASFLEPTKCRFRVGQFVGFRSANVSALAEQVSTLGDHHRTAETVQVLHERFPKFCDDYAEAVRLVSRWRKGSPR
jgi:hypothetical protein